MELYKQNVTRKERKNGEEENKIESVNNRICCER